jgi:hypothetical protein
MIEFGAGGGLSEESGEALAVPVFAELTWGPHGWTNTSKRLISAAKRIRLLLSQRAEGFLSRRSFSSGSARKRISTVCGKLPDGWGARPTGWVTWQPRSTGWRSTVLPEHLQRVSCSANTVLTNIDLNQNRH